MVDVVQREDGGGPKLRRQEGPECPRRYVSKDICSPNFAGDDGQRGRREHRLNLGARELGERQFRKIQRLRSGDGGLLGL